MTLLASKDKLQTSLWTRFNIAMRTECERYRSRGWHNILSALVFIAYFTIYRDLIRAVWPSLNGTMPDIFLYTLMVVGINLAVIIGYNLFSISLFILRPSFLEKYRVDRNLPWPWESHPKQWPKKCMKGIALNLFNGGIVGGFLTIADAWTEFNYDMSPETEPTLFTILWQTALFMATAEIGFYFAHRLFHHPSLYWMHKIHHSFNSTIPLAVYYSHPVEHAIANVIPVGIGYKLLARFYPVHIYTLIIWITFRMVETFDGHSGYDWPWEQAAILPFASTNGYHSFHHSRNVGNYGGMFYIVDTLLGTNDDYQKHTDKREYVKSE